MNPTYPGIIAAILYMTGGFLQFKVLFRRATPSVRAMTLCAVPAVLAHGLATLWLMTGDAGVHLGLFPMLALSTFTLALVVLLGATRLPLQSLTIVVFPFCAISLLIATLFHAPSPPMQFSFGLTVHILLSVAAYTVLTIAACQSLLLAVQERHLKTKRSFAVLRVLPPLETMEALLFHLIWSGFALLSLSITSGFVYLDDMFAQHVVHHTALALGSWTVFGVLLFGRYRLGWRSATAVRWTLLGFGLLVVGYLGSKVVLEIILAQ